jgi:hypothetical protein
MKDSDQRKIPGLRRGLIEEKSLFRVVGLILESKVKTQAEVVSVRWSKEWSYAVKICYLE